LFAIFARERKHVLSFNFFHLCIWFENAGLISTTTKISLLGTDKSPVQQKLIVVEQ